MRRAVIDTNCLVASIIPRSPYYRLYELFKAEAFEWVVSNEILTEYEEFSLAIIRLTPLIWS